MLVELHTTKKWLSIAEAIHKHQVVDGWSPVMSSPQAAVYYNQAQAVFIKIFYEPRLKHKIKNILIPSTSRHKRFIKRTEDLRRLNIPAPAILAFGLIDSHGYVVTQAFPGMGLGTFLAQYLNESKNNHAIRCWKKDVMSLLGIEIAHLHNASIAHGDLRPNNILLNCLSLQPAFCFIDNERNTVIKKSLEKSEIIKNLVQLNMMWPEDISATYRRRLINSYLSHIDMKKYPWLANNKAKKEFISEIHKTTRKRLKGKTKGGYNIPNEFEPFTPEFLRKLSDVKK